MPTVLPLIEPYKISLRALKGLGIEARPVWPLHGLYALSPEAHAQLKAAGRVEVAAPASDDEAICQCRHCRFGWLHDDLTTAPPEHCPSCGRAGWNTIVLVRCQQCGHEYEQPVTSSACPCCGLGGDKPASAS